MPATELLVLTIGLTQAHAAAYARRIASKCPPGASVAVVPNDDGFYVVQVRGAWCPTCVGNGCDACGDLGFHPTDADA